MANVTRIGMAALATGIAITEDRPDRGIGQSDKSASDHPGTVWGVNPTTDGTSRRRS